jgi:hypothetical protein
VQERQIKLAEEQTRLMKDLLEGVMKEVDLTPAQRKRVGPAIRTQLAIIESKAVEVVG